MKILSILPLTDSFSISKAGAASLFVREIDKNNKNLFIAGSTIVRDIISPKKYINFLSLSKIPKGRNYSYAKKIISYLKKNTFDIIEVHNRPQIAKILLDELPNIKIILYLHNDPDFLRSSSTPKEKIYLLEKCSKIIFLSQWIRDKFFKNINFKNSDKTDVVYPAIGQFKKKIIRKKEILFAGKLNTSKGYDIFCNIAKEFLKKRKDWKFIVAGDEPREIIKFNHKNFINLGWISHQEVIKLYKRVSIVIIPSTWDEPLGRVPIEASKNGAISITSNKGGLTESSPYSLVDHTNSAAGILKILNNLVKNEKQLENIIDLNLKYTYLRTNISFVRKKIYEIRKSCLRKQIYLNFNNPIKILHAADLHIRHNGRLYYSTVKKLNNGFILNNYNLQNFSDRDIQSYNKSFIDLKGSVSLNKNLLNYFSNFRPDLFILGHADNISKENLKFIKTIYPGVKVAQWFLDPLIKTGPDYRKNVSRVKAKFDLCDANFITTAPDHVNLKQKKLYYLPNPVDKTIDNLSIYKNKDPIYDLFIAISHGQHRAKLKKGRIDKRIDEIKNLVNSNNIKINLFGFDKEPVWGDSFFEELKKCSMALNLSRGKPIKYYSSDRIASLMGNGLLTFIKKGYSFENFFNNKEIVLYNDETDLIKKIVYYKKNIKKRDEIAKNGQKKYFKLFNNKLVSRYIVNKTLNIKINTGW